ncbi:MAG: choice-of-anchor Q domain-containing protein [Anaerolineae bacterium]
MAPDADAVVVPAGEYPIEIADLGPVEPADGAADELQGDLDVRGPLTIEGDGRAAVELTGKGDYTILHVHRAGKLTLRGVFVHDSGAVGATTGACVYNEGELSVDDSAFRDCITAIKTDGPVVVTDSYFAGNESTGGGAIETHYARGTVVVERSRFVRNKATAGGAISSDFGAVRVSDSSFEANSATGGGAIDVANAPLLVERSSFQANEATGGAAIEFDGQASDAPVTIKDSSFEANLSRTPSGGGLILGRRGTVVNTTIDAPAGNLSGAIIAGGAIRLDHVTLAGGGLVVGGGTADVHSSLLVGARCTGIVVSRGTNVVSDSDCPLMPQPSDRLDVVAPLLPMADNGGPTRSRLPDMSAGAHPAVDGADPDGCPATDQRGYARPAGAGCDVGAVEVGAAPPARTATPTATTSYSTPGAATPSPTRPWNPPTVTPVPADRLPDRLELTAQMGGALADMVLWGTSGAVLAGPELRVVDVTDPDAPRVTGRLSFDRLGLALAGPTEDGMVLALLEGSPPELVEVKVAFTPRPTVWRRWRLPEPPPPTHPWTPDWPVTRSADLAMVGQRVYAAWTTPFGDAPYLLLYVLDLAAPNPTWNVVNSRRCECSAVVDLAVTPTRAFLVFRPNSTWSEFTTDRVAVVGLDSQTDGLLSENGVAPLVAIAARDETAWAIGQRVRGLPPPSGYARPNRVMTIDAADATKPRVASTTPLTPTIPLQGAALSGDRLWLVAGADVTRPGESALLALDVTVPDAPAVLGRPVALGAYARVVAAAGDRVAVGDAGGWLRMVAADGEQATARGELAGLGPVFEVAFDGPRLYAAGEAGAASLSIVGLDDPSAPRLVSAWGRDHRRLGQGYPIGVAAAGNTVWVADGTGAYAVDVADPAAPKPAGHWLEAAVDVAVDGDTAWLIGMARGAAGAMELHAVAADGRTAASRGPFAPRESLMSITFGDDHILYAATLNGTVVGLAPEGEGAPRFLAALDPSQSLRGARGPGMFNLPCCYGQVAVSDGIGLAAFANATFFRAGASGPGDVLASVAGPSGQVEGAAMDDGRVVLAAGGDGVGLIDARDASRPVIRGWTDTPGRAHRVAVDGPWVYVADGAGGLRVYRAVVDAAPRPVARAWLPWGGRP